MSEVVGFIGLGHMGLPMAQNLLRAGYRLRVYNRTPAKAAALAEQGAELVGRPADVAAPGGIVITMVANDQALEAVTLGTDGFGERLGPGGVHLSMNTVSPAIAQRLAAHYETWEVAYVAAPVFGRPDAAAARKLWVCVSGPQAAKERVRPVLDALGQGVFDFGAAPEAAHVVKVAGNFLIVSAMEAMAEAFTLAEKHGIERGQIASMLAQTIFACPIYQNYGKMIAEETYAPAGFRLALGAKDLNLVLDAASTARMPMPFASLLRDRMLSALAKGRAELDWTAVGLAVSEDAGLK